MYIEESQISCGIQELTCIGENPKLFDYEQAMIDGYDNLENLGCFIIASVPYKWNKSVKFLKSIGFKSSGVRKNPNSGNKIVLFSKTLSAKERKHFRGNRCKVCNELVPTSKRLCDYCKKDKSY